MFNIVTLKICMSGDKLTKTCVEHAERQSHVVWNKLFKYFVKKKEKYDNIFKGKMHKQVEGLI